jgi:hypothetical protein
LSVHGQAETPPSLISSGARNALLFILAALQINGVIRIGPRHNDPSLDNPSLDHLPVPLAIFSVIFLLLYLVDAFWYFRQGKRRMYHDVVAKTQVVPAGALHRYFWWVLFALLALSNLTEALKKGAQSL